MQTTLDSYLGIHAQALPLEARRNELLAANLANVDTPNYKARDLDFKAALSAAADASLPGGSSTGASFTPALRAANASPQASPAATTTLTGDAAVDPAFLKYRVPMAPSLDGNTVDEQLEQSAFVENTVRYQATFTFLNGKLKDLMTAIVGS